MLLNYRIITSIKGIGKINAWMTIAYTENFTSFPDARTYAVYVGVLPFGHRSGTSIKGRTRVSHLANKELKQELNQAAKAAINHDPELKAYAERKLKNKCFSLVLNNVKFKLILRMFSLVKRGEMYVDNYRRAA
jgi:transposase